LEKTLHTRAERKTVRGFKNFGWWSKFSFCYLVTRKDTVMPSKECVKQVKVKSFAFYTGACAFALGVITMLFVLK
jgi:hypothetical protein